MIEQQEGDMERIENYLDVAGTINMILGSIPATSPQRLAVRWALHAAQDIASGDLASAASDLEFCSADMQAADAAEAPPAAPAPVA